MTAETLFDLIGNAEEALIADAAEVNERKKPPTWLRWGAVAACVCLLTAGALGFLLHPRTSGGGIDVPGGSWPEGIDPKMASVAVYPASEQIQDLVSAAMDPIGEEDACKVDMLGGFLPAALPTGYRYQQGDLYTTVMANGNTYHMLRVLYSRGGSVPQGDGPSGIHADSFLIFLMDYEPGTGKRINVYKPADDHGYLIRLYPQRDGNGTFYLQCGDVYIGIEPLSLTEEELHALLDDITEGWSLS